MSSLGIDGWRFKAIIVSVIVATVAYLAFSLWGGWQDVVNALVRIGVQGTLLALALSLFNYGLRFFRWQLYLGHLGHRVPVLPSLRIYLAGFALTTTPGKAGEVFRGVLLKSRGVPLPTTFAAFISERLSDLVAITLLALVGLSLYPKAQPIVVAGGVFVVLVLIAISSQRLIDCLQAYSQDNGSRLLKALGYLAHLLHDTRRCHTPIMLLGNTMLSLLAWGAEALAFFLVLDWLGTDIDLVFAVFVYALSMLAGALSFMPGGLGGAEVVMVSLLVLKDMPTPEAVAATVFIRLATLWFAVIIGIIALYNSRHGEEA
ncbi:flippase-like domain-containing protein [Spongiibacter sp. KMU-158]|uniref:Flippase-like domain-containing protein n=2 Tax=Spongiibacter pelagi TaxID=2760804 RepID=A0A927C3L4_9GAMM|nr:flippase-like domain-containing protein [Spongiibacter pelagi]